MPPSDNAHGPSTIYAHGRFTEPVSWVDSSGIKSQDCLQEHPINTALSLSLVGNHLKNKEKKK